MDDAPHNGPKPGTDQAAPDFWSRLRQMGRLIVHIPDYDTYIKHLQATQPGAPLPTYEEFIDLCQKRRFSSGYLIGKC